MTPRDAYRIQPRDSMYPQDVPPFNLPAASAYRPIVYVPQLRVLPVPAANDDRPTPPGSAQAVAA